MGCCVLCGEGVRVPHMSMETILKRIRQAFAFSNYRPIPIKVMWMRCFDMFRGFQILRPRSWQAEKRAAFAMGGKFGCCRWPLWAWNRAFGQFVLSRLCMFLVEVV